MYGWNLEGTRIYGPWVTGDSCNAVMQEARNGGPAKFVIYARFVCLLVQEMFMQRSQIPFLGDEVVTNAHLRTMKKRRA